MGGKGVCEAQMVSACIVIEYVQEQCVCVGVCVGVTNMSMSLFMIKV